VAAWAGCSGAESKEQRCRGAAASTAMADSTLSLEAAAE